MDLTSQLHDPAYDLPVPPDALTSIRRRARALRRRRQALIAVPSVAVVLAVLPLLGGGGQASTLYGAGAQPTPSPTEPPLPPQPPQDATSMNCVIGGTEADFGKNGGVIANLLTGDPVADCAELGRQQGFSVPLRAYGDGSVFLTVVPASWTVPPTYVPLPDGFTVDAKRLALRQALEDPIDGASYTLDDNPCRTDDQAIADAQAILQGLALTYDVQKYDAAPVANGTSICARALLKEGSRTVLITANDRFSSEPAARTPLHQFLSSLATDVARACLTRAEATKAVQNAAVTATLPSSGYRIETTTVGGGRCTRIDDVSFATYDVIILRTA